MSAYAARSRVKKRMHAPHTDWVIGNSGGYLKSAPQKSLLFGSLGSEDSQSDAARLLVDEVHLNDPIYDFWRTSLEASGARQRERAAKFEQLRTQWEDETAYSGSVMHRVTHGAYQQIIGMGSPVLGDILRSLRDSPDHWFWALSAISGEDPAEGAQTFEEARQRWLGWGRERGHLA